MMPTAHEVFTVAVLKLPPKERLRLAALILDDLTTSDSSQSDYSEDWSDEDIADMQAFTLRRFDEEEGISK